MDLKNNTPNNIKRPLKRSKTGLEAEFHLIDNEGYVQNKAKDIISAIENLNENIVVTKEVGQSMIEFGCYPGVQVFNPFLDMIKSIERAIDICEDHDLSLYPFGTYPGEFKPKLNDHENYKIKQKVFGSERSDILASVVGFHHHYTLPKGVFDAATKKVRILKKSKLERSMVSSYNLEIAADPALSLYAQSSPFYMGSNIAKDSRAVVYRGGKKLKYLQGAYGRMQQMGGLPPYKQTATDLLSSLRNRTLRWKRVIKKADPNIDFNELYPYKLDVGWNPVKLNKHGTLEQRGMDMNFMSVIAGISTLLKYSLREIQTEFVEVLPADFGYDECFKLENGILYIPPHTEVRNDLQKASIYEGYGNNKMHRYSKRFYNFAKSLTPKKYYKVIKAVETMIDKKQSMSDKILAYAKRKKFLVDNTISKEDAAELALYYSKVFAKDLRQTKEILSDISII